MAATAPLARFEAACREGRLVYQVDAAGRAIFEPRADPGLAWRESRGLGVVYATTVVHRAGEPPLNVALVALDEGFRMMSRVEGVAPEAVTIGQRVRIAFREADGECLPVFEMLHEVDR